MYLRAGTLFSLDNGLLKPKQASTFQNYFDQWCYVACFEMLFFLVYGMTMVLKTNCTQTVEIHLLIGIFFAVTIMVAYNELSNDQTKINIPSSHLCGMQTNAHSC